MSMIKEFKKFKDFGKKDNNEQLKELCILTANFDAEKNRIDL